jgi:TetR/AcrR family transcriptional regulator, transcriptional repressor for nem operon
MTEFTDTRADQTRHQILVAAARQFATRSFDEVSLNDILADTDVTKGALYFHFRSKHALALAIIEHHAAAVRADTAELLTRRLTGLETMIEITFMVATHDVSDEFARASVHLVDAIGRHGGRPAEPVDEWIKGSVAVLEQAMAEGDVRSDCDPDELAKVLVSHYVGIRNVNDLDDASAFLTAVRNSWRMTLPGFARPDRVDYLAQFVDRRAAAAMRNLGAARG